MCHSIHFNERVRGKLTDVCNYASGIRNERPKLLAMVPSCTLGSRWIVGVSFFMHAMVWWSHATTSSMAAQFASLGYDTCTVSPKTEGL